MTSEFRHPSRREVIAGAAFFRPGARNLSIAGIRFRVVEHGSSTWRFLHIHGDETTAREALNAIEKSHRGTSYFVESQTRMVPIAGGTIDPNRMFSEAGAERNLRSLNDSWTARQVEAALHLLERDRPKFLSRILPPQGGILVALHNNSQGYSIRTETPISEKVSLKAPSAPHEFLLATNPDDFAVLEKSQFNCVLQSKPGGEDDGSLSRLCASRGIRYINIEAALGRLAEQQAMLEWILANLPDRRNV